MVGRIFLLVVLAHVLALGLAAQSPSPVIPRTWDDEAVATLEVPLANPEFSPKQVSADYYYRLRVRPIYKSYPVYAPDKEPPGYIEWLAKQEPEIVFDPAQLHTEADWIRAGELVFDAPTIFAALDASPARDPEFYARSGVRLAANGTLPNKSYVIREKGVVEVGNFSCGQCHTRVMPDGAVVKGAQGNFAAGYFFAARPRAALRNGRSSEAILAQQRANLRREYGAPWIQPPLEGNPEMSLDEILAAYEAQPPGVGIRQGTSLRYPAAIPDLIGIKDRLYLDHTGLVRHRSIGDLMRYAALNQSLDQLARYGDFVPAGEVPDPTTSRSPAAWRYSDEQLYALAMYLYSLKPPPNPNKFDALAAKGQTVFSREGCASCHTPPLYTNNKLTPAEGFTIPAGHAERFDIMPRTVGTDSNSALKTRRGTGYYKVPSLRGVWYRGPFEHNGSVATLEDWFDPRRLRDDYVPTGHIGYGLKTRAVKGHRFGLDLSTEDKKALIAFLKTL
jgi:mono/diheme cytochrome c family protein